MSGIAGIMVRRGGKPAGAEDIERMMASMRHRGPNGTTSWTGPKAVLGHCLLQTAGGDESGLVAMAGDGFVITANARLDGRDELLAALGEEDRSLSDAALILRAYRRWGEACADHLSGYFAFAIWDEARQALFCARDHFGVRPFYYSSTDARFVFASEIKPIFSVDGADRRPSEDHISGFLAGVPDAPQSSPYLDIFRLPAGHCLVADGNGVRIRSYWTLESSRPYAGKDAYEAFRHLFETAVRNRLRGTTNAGAMLSGGLDSSSICCVARRFEEGDRKLPTFSMVFGKGTTMDEKPYIDSVLAQGGFNSHLIPIKDYAPFAEFDRLLAEQESTFGAPGLSLTRDVYRTASANGVTVLLDGHGGDEVVSHGYGRLHELAAERNWLELWRQLEGAASTYGEGRLGFFMRLFVMHGPAGWRLAKARSLSRRMIGKLLPSKPHSSGAADGFVNADLATRTRVDERFRQATLMPRSVASSETSAHLWTLSSGLVAQSFEVLDKAAANFGIEPRYPFWDKALVEFCLSLPAEQKLDRGYGRYVLRRAMEGILPPKVQWRRDKVDFKAALVGGMIGHHRGLLEEVLVSNSGAIAPYVNLPVARSAYHRILKDPVKVSLTDVQNVWRSVSLSLWLRQLQRAEAQA